jgi:hypothetical protein
MLNTKTKKEKKMSKKKDFFEEIEKKREKENEELGKKRNMENKNNNTKKSKPSMVEGSQVLPTIDSLVDLDMLSTEIFKSMGRVCLKVGVKAYTGNYNTHIIHTLSNKVTGGITRSYTEKVKRAHKMARTICFKTPVSPENGIEYLQEELKNNHPNFEFMITSILEQNQYGERILWIRDAPKGHERTKTLKMKTIDKISALRFTEKQREKAGLPLSDNTCIMEPPKKSILKRKCM